MQPTLSSIPRSTAMSTGPDDSCLTCRKRQVRCDGKRPICARCPKDARDCRGYKGQLRIVQVNPVKTPRAPKAPKPIQQKPGALVPPGAIDVTSFPLVKHIFISDRDLWTLVDCANYWNNNVIPSTFPAERPFFRPYIMGDEIAVQPIPKICLHLVIVAFRATQAAKLLIDPVTQPDVCYYRGMGLRELPKYLEEAGTDPHAVALMSVVMLITSDIVTRDGSWLVHLDAARRIVDLRGGMGACVSSVPDSIFVLTQLYLIDTLTSATCKSAKLPDVSLADTIGDIPNIDFQLITCASTCPVEVLQVIARTSSLRRRIWRRGTSPNTSSSPTTSFSYTSLLDELNGFDSAAWASRISHLGLSYPVQVSNVAPCSSTEGLSSVAECFRSAALVYLILSCNTVIEEGDMDTVRCACKVLLTNVNELFDKASQDWNTPLDTQLWKFVTWPLVVAAYAWIGWGIEVEGLYLETLFSRLKFITGAKSLLSMPGATPHLQEVRSRRADFPDLCWTWDKGFKERNPFVL